MFELLQDCSLCSVGLLAPSFWGLCRIIEVSPPSFDLSRALVSLVSSGLGFLCEHKSLFPSL